MREKRDYLHQDERGAKIEEGRITSTTGGKGDRERGGLIILRKV